MARAWPTLTAEPFRALSFLREEADSHLGPAVFSTNWKPLPQVQPGGG